MALPHATDTTAQPLHPLVGRVLSERYQILGFAGTGGMASVYRARDLVLGRTVAVKLLHPKLAGDPELVARFEREAEFAAGLSGHPNIVAIFDVGADGDLRYIVMEVIEGRDLADVIAAEAPLAVNRALCIAEEIAVALAFAHRHGLVHRDIKPQNILLLPDGRVKVTDFGIAWNGESTPMTRAGMVLGTTHYLSPEQALGRPPGPRSDLYALGVVLYQMLTGEVPFDGEDRFEVAMSHVNEPVPPIERMNGAVPRAVGDIVRRALSKDPEARYASADEMAGALREAQREAPAPPSRPVVRAIRPVLHSATAVMTAPLLFPSRPAARVGGKVIPRILGGACLLAVLAGVGIALTERSSPIHHPAASPPRIKRVRARATATPPLFPDCTGTNAGAVSLLAAQSAPPVISPGGAVTITYTVQNRSNACIPLYLRASAAPAYVPGQTISDAADGRPVRLPPGTHQFQRLLRFPAAAAAGGIQSFSIGAGISIYDGPRVGDQVIAYAVTVNPS